MSENLYFFYKKGWENISPKALDYLSTSPTKPRGILNQALETGGKGKMQQKSLFLVTKRGTQKIELSAAAPIDLGGEISLRKGGRKGRRKKRRHYRSPSWKTAQTFFFRRSSPLSPPPQKKKEEEEAKICVQFRGPEAEMQGERRGDLACPSGIFLG